MIVLTQSHGWRVFVPANYKLVSADKHLRLASLCIWEGADKTETYEGIECKGYEFRSLREATDAVNAVFGTNN